MQLQRVFGTSMKCLVSEGSIATSKDALVCKAAQKCLNEEWDCQGQEQFEAKIC